MLKVLTAANKTCVPHMCFLIFVHLWLQNHRAALIVHFLDLHNNFYLRYFKFVFFVISRSCVSYVCQVINKRT